MSDEKDRKVSESERLEKENRRLTEQNKQYREYIIQLLKEGIESAERISLTADETIQKSAIATDLAYQTMQGALKVADLASSTTQIVDFVVSNSKQV
jgi:hypothetical protein